MNVYTHIYAYNILLHTSAQHTRVPCVGTFHLQVEGLRQDVVFHVLVSGMTSMLGFSRE